MMAAIDAYFAAFPEDAPRLAHLRAQTGGNLFSRANAEGHVTASALLFDAGMENVLLIHHNGLNRWLQPGGHVEDDPSLAAAALRETQEETGIAGAHLHPWHGGHGGTPFDIDTQDIPASPRKGEPAHVHHDCLYLLIAPADAAVTLQPEEVSAAQWRALSSLTDDPRFACVYARAKAWGII
jgi:8-oxo-dGTP pyrophosphatase MutT (NUDIX family)